jgi:hypothetical protein
MGITGRSATPPTCPMITRPRGPRPRPRRAKCFEAYNCCRYCSCWYDWCGNYGVGIADVGIIVAGWEGEQRAVTMLMKFVGHGKVSFGVVAARLWGASAL